MTGGESANTDVTDSSIVLLLAYWRDHPGAVRPRVRQRRSLSR